MIVTPLIQLCLPGDLNSECAVFPSVNNEEPFQDCSE